METLKIHVVHVTTLQNQHVSAAKYAAAMLWSDCKTPAKEPKLSKEDHNYKR